MDAKALAAALRRRREKWVPTGEGKKVKFLRPTEAEMPAMLRVEGDVRNWVVGNSDVQRLVTDWEGYTEADILGASIGSSDPVEFNSELWAEVIADDITLTRTVADAILKAVVDYINEKDSTAKN